MLADGTLGPGKVFFDVTSSVGDKMPGLPDGMKVDNQGHLFATGPGGCYIFTPEGKVLGGIETGEKTANCAWGNDGTVLYLCADMYLCRVKTTTRGRMVGGSWRRACLSVWFPSVAPKSLRSRCRTGFGTTSRTL